VSAPTTIRGVASIDELLRPLNNIIVELRALIDAAKSGNPELLEPITFKTEAVLGNTFPLFIRRSAKFAPRGLVLAKIEDITNPAALLTSAVVVHWENDTGGLVRIKYVTGLSTSNEYRLTFLAVK